MQKSAFNHKTSSHQVIRENYQNADNEIDDLSKVNDKEEEIGYKIVSEENQELIIDEELALNNDQDEKLENAPLNSNKLVNSLEDNPLDSSGECIK